MLRNVFCFSNPSKTMVYMSFWDMRGVANSTINKEFVHYFNMLYTKKSIGIITSAYFLE